MKRICIDPGHGGKDPGAVGPKGRREKDVALAVSLKLKKLLEGNYKVLLTRSEDIFIELYQRAILSNAFGADLFLSIHCNAASSPMAQGFEIWTSKGHTKSDGYASIITTEWSKAFASVNIRGDWSDGDVDKEANFCVLRRTAMPAVLVELDFLTNPKMEALLSDDAYQDIMANALYQGVVSALGEGC
jgi:N-acetylmuramoyl-L-alanine amidase